MKLGELISDYVGFKQSLGMSFETNASLLRAFCRMVGNAEVEQINFDSILRYLYGNGGASYCYRKYQALSGLYRYATARGYVIRSSFPETKPRLPPAYVPYIYTPQELSSLMKAAETLDASGSHIDALTFRTLLLLLFNTGLRIGEALSLKLADVSLSENLLVIRNSKFGKSRLVPINLRLGELLGGYIAKKHAAPLDYDQDPPVFVYRNGLPISHWCVEMTFRRLCNHCGIRRDDGSRYQPRLHDIRHTFAVSRLLEWYRNGYDVQRFLPHLSTYLGHVEIASTQSYLRMIPQLLREAASLFEKYALSEANNVR